MQRKGKGKKTFYRERRLFANCRKGRTDAEKLNYKIISMRTRDLKQILSEPDKEDLLTISFAQEELDRRNFNQKHQIDTKKKRTKLDKQYPEHKHLLKKHKKRKFKKPS